MATPTLDYRPEKTNVKYRRGDTTGVPIQFNDAAGEPIDLTGRTWTAQIRRSPNSATAVDITVDTTDANIGQIVLRLEPDITETMSGEYEWDLQQDLGGSIQTILAGRWTFDPDVTRPA